MLDFALGRALKRLFDANDFPWLLPLPPWSPARERRVRQIRRAARAALRRRDLAIRGWPRILAASAAWPLVSLLKALIDARTPGRLHRSLFLSILDAWWLQLAHNLRIADLHYFRLDRPATRRAALLFVTDGENKYLLETINRQCPSRSIGDKRAFAAFCARHGLPTPPLLAYGPGDGAEPILAAAWPSSDLFLKPASLWGGQGAWILRHDPSLEVWRTDSGAAVTPATIAAVSRELVGRNSWVLQPRLANSPAFAGLAPTDGALAAVRLITGRRLPDGPVTVFGCFMRFPKARSTVDNLCAGGIGADLDLATGTLHPARSLAPASPFFTHHPDTGAPLAGQPIPHWDELAALACRAHAPITDLATIGWDVALTAEGPVLIEANPNWGVPLDTPLGATAYVDYLLQPTVVGAFPHAHGS